MDNQKISEDIFFRNFRQKLGEEIKAIRLLRGYSSEKLAEMLDVKTNTLSKIEEGKFSISVDYLAKLSVLLNHRFTILDK